jgi:hypothetical protein
MKLSTLFLIAAVSTAAIVPFTGCSDPSPRKSEPPAHRYRITHYLPSGEAKVYNAFTYSSYAGGVFFYTRERHEGGCLVKGSYLVEEIAP